MALGHFFIQIVAALDHDENVADDEDGGGGVCDGCNHLRLFIRNIAKGTTDPGVDYFIY